MKGQKQAVVEMVQQELPNFIPYKDMALVMLSKDQLERIKYNVGVAMMNRQVEYSKPIVYPEVMAYARSMVMNHLKKARELNGNQVYGSTPAMVQSREQDRRLSKVNLDILPDDLKAFVKSLV